MHRTLTIALVVAACHPRPHVIGPPKRMSARDIVKESTPAIVTIETGEPDGRRHGLGTGFVIDKSGVIATNLHVIAGESAIRVKMHDESQPEVVAIVGVDPHHDLALLRVKAVKPLPTVRLGDSSTLVAGDQVYAIGNPIGFAETLSSGLFSNARELAPDLTILQISAPISSGSSGGPLFNQFGEVVGVTTWIALRDGRGAEVQNINFAVPTTYLGAMLTKQVALAPADFAKLTRGREEPPPPDEKEVVRQVPDHDPKILFDGCSRKDVIDVVGQIEEAIQLGAPEYNKQTVPREIDDGSGTKVANPAFDARGFEKCFRIYEGVATKFEHDGACKGVQRAFGDGLLRAGAFDDFKRKAWAMRDTFDGILIAVEKWQRAHP